MNFFRDRAGRRPCGFTLVELLVVIVIIGVMIAVIGPTFSTGSDTARVKTASRGVMQMSRYARTMALLHQKPVDLVYTSSGGLRVEEVAVGGEGLVSAAAFGSTNMAADAEAAAERAGKEDGPVEPGKADEGASGGSSYVMADLNIEKTFEQVVFHFEGYSDTMDDGRSRKSVSTRRDAEREQEEGQEGEDVRVFKVRYKSNGTCRPYTVRVEAEGNESSAVRVVVDVLGAAKVEEEDE